MLTRGGRIIEFGYDIRTEHSIYGWTMSIFNIVGNIPLSYRDLEKCMDRKMRERRTGEDDA